MIGAMHRSRECSSLHSSGFQLNESNVKQIQRRQKGGGVEKNLEQDMHELQSLSKRLLMKNCGLSVVCMLFLLLLVLGIHIYIYIQFWSYEKGIQKSEMGEKLMFEEMFTHYSKAIDYLHYASSITLNTLSASLLSPPLQQYAPSLHSPQDYPQIYRQKLYGSRGGLECITPSKQQICLRLNPLSSFLWQYSQVPSIKNFVKKIIICANVTTQSIKTSEYGCIGIPITGAYSQDALHAYLRSNEHFLVDQLSGKVLLLSQTDEEFTAGYYQNFLNNSTVSSIFIMMTVSKSLAPYLTNLTEGISIFSKNLFVFNLNLQSTFQNSDESITYEQILSAEGHPISDFTPDDYSSTVFSFNQTKNNGIFVQFSFTYYEIIAPTPIWKFQPGIFIFLLIVYIVFFQVRNIKNYTFDLFSRKQLLNRLYKLSIKEIFAGKKPIPSFVMKKGPLGSFFYQLSQVIDRSLTPILSQKCTQLKKKPFKFKNKTQTLVNSYKAIISNLMQIKNRQILNNRFSIQSYINSVCENEVEQLKQYYLKAVESNILLEFFKFGYMSILRVPGKYMKFVKEDTSPMPEELIRYFSRINKQIHEVDVMREKIQLQIMKNNFKMEDQDSNYIQRLQNTNEAEHEQQVKNQPILHNLKQINISEANQNQSIPTHVEILKKPNRDLFSKSRSKFNDRKNLRDKVESDQSVGQVVMFSNSEMQQPEMSYKNSSRRQSRRKSAVTKSRENNTISNLESVEQENKQNWEEEETKEQLQIRIRVLMIPKYLAMFKDLDLQNQYAKKLELEKQLINVSEIIDNTRYLLTRHNKNIRVFSKSTS